MQNTQYSQYLRQIFNRDGSYAAGMFPARLQYFRIYTSSGDLIYASTAAKGEKQFSATSLLELLHKMRTNAIAVRHNHAAGTIVLDENAIRLPRLKNTDRYYTSRNALQNIVTIFDHELGHLLLPSGLDPRTTPHHHECAAEAYAILRHLQRYRRTDILENYLRTACNGIFKKNGAYYTVVIAQKIEQLAKTRSIRTLSPQETVDLAEKTAKDYHFEDKTLRKIQIALSPAYDAVKKTIDFEKAFSIMKAHTEDGDIYRAARLVLRQMQKIPQDMQAFMGNYEKESGINVNLAEAMDAQKSPSSPGPKKFDI